MKIFGAEVTRSITLLLLLALPHLLHAQGAGEGVYIPDSADVRNGGISGFRIYLVEEKGVRLRHDSLQQTYLFDTLGHLVRNVRYFQESQVIYRYEPGGEKLEVTWKDIDPEQTDSSTTIYRYDRNGNLLENYSPGNGPGSGTVYSYRDGRLVETRFYGMVARAQYDSLGNMVAEPVIDGDGNWIRGDLYTYDSVGNITAFCMLDDDSIAYACHLRTYNEREELIRNRIVRPGIKGNRQEMEEMTKAESRTLGHDQQMYEYIRNEKGFITEERTYEGEDDELVKIVRFEYDYRPTPGAFVE